MINIKDFTFNYTLETEFFWKEGDNYAELNKALDKSIENAYKDIMVRTLKRKEIEKTSNNFKKFKNLILEYIDKGTFPEASDDFDKFHNKLCLSVLECLELEYVEVKYGKAQKLVNMTFKYLYCTKYISDNDKRSLFDNCHIALDSIILEWLYKYVYPNYKIDNQELNESDNPHDSNLTRDCTPSWSNLIYSKDQDLVYDNKYTYNFFIKIIRKYFDNINIDITPFQAEFIIWREMQMELAIKEFLNSYKKYCKNPDIDPSSLIKENNVTNQLNKIHELLENLPKN